MACDSFLTFAPKVIGTSSLQVQSLTQLQTTLAFYAANFDCPTALLVLQGLIAPGNAFVPDGFVLNKTDITIVNVSSPPGTVINLIIDGVTYGGWTLTGGIWVDNTTYGNTYTLGPGGIASLTTSFSAGWNITANISSGVTGGDYPGYLGCAVPICAISPPVTLPVVGATIKCANYTKLFNPLGLSLKDI